MSIKDKVKMLLKEAELYKAQRLLKESKAKYLEAITLINTNDQIPNKESLISAISKKIEFLNTGITRWEQSASKPEVSSKVQDLIKKLFTSDDSSGNEAVKSLKSAITLAKFGQYKRAIKEFNNLVGVEQVAIPAAKNSLKCIIEIGSIEDALAQYYQWAKSDSLNEDKKMAIRNYLQEIMERQGIAFPIDVSGTKEELPKKTIDEKHDHEDEDIIDITSIGIRFNHGPKKGEHVELDVSFQAGNVLSLIVSSNDKLLIESLKVGVRLDDMDFYSPIAIFKGSGVVETNTRIETGPKRGDYSLDIKIHSI